MAIGGAVNFEEPVIFRNLIERAGGRNANIVVLPQASEAAGQEYCDTFQLLGVKRKPVSLEFRERTEADKKKHLGALRDATGIFLTGGTQMRITSSIGGTDFEQELLAAYRRGTVICGTSAGAAARSI